MIVVDRTAALVPPGPPKVTAEQLYAARFSDELAFPPLIALGHKVRTLDVEPRSLQLHSHLPPTPLWCYVARTDSGEQVNPTLQALRGRPSLLRYRNRLAGRTLPVTVTSVHGTDQATDGVVVVSNFPGPGCPEPNFVVEEGLRRGDGTFVATDLVPPVLARHLHGGNTEARSDGWTENLIATDQASIYQYSNDQAATMLWYHDHAAHVTRLTVATRTTSGSCTACSCGPCTSTRRTARAGPRTSSHCSFRTSTSTRTPTAF